MQSEELINHSSGLGLPFDNRCPMMKKKGGKNERDHGALRLQVENALTVGTHVLRSKDTDHQIQGKQL